MHKQGTNGEDLGNAEGEDFLQLFYQTIFKLNLAALFFLQNCLMLLVVLKVIMGIKGDHLRALDLLLSRPGRVSMHIIR